MSHRDLHSGSMSSHYPSVHKPDGSHHEAHDHIDFEHHAVNDMKQNLKESGSRFKSEYKH